MSSHSDSDGVGSIPASPDARNVALLLCQERFNEVGLSASLNNRVSGPSCRLSSAARQATGEQASPASGETGAERVATAAGRGADSDGEA